MTESEDMLLNNFEAARMLNVKAATLDTWRSTRRVQIPFCRIGRAIRYRKSDLVAFIDRQTVGGDDILKSKSPQASTLNRRITDFSLSARTRNCLRRAQIQTIGDLMRRRNIAQRDKIDARIIRAVPPRNRMIKAEA